METPDARLAALIDELRDVLEAERRALLSGSADEISALALRKTTIGERIEAATAVPGAQRPDPASLSPLARYNQENGTICATMLRHLTDAIDRLRRHEPHRSYKSDGSEESRSMLNKIGAA
jgi:flagellar biosynthesis/type III secretory pathway chaperone